MRYAQPLKVRALTLRPFRNLDDSTFSFDADRVLITGPNARGKSNILEAISYLSIGRSVRGSRDQEAIPHGGGFFDIRGTCERGRQERMFRLFFGREEGKRAFADGDALARISDLIGLFRTVHFAPEGVSLVLRFPAQRRRLLDILNSQSSLEYVRRLQRYQRVLAQRNAILRSPGNTPESVLSSWTEQLAITGGWIRRARLHSVAVMRARFRDCVHRLGEAAEAVDVCYRGVCQDAGSQEEVLLHQLHEKASRERDVGHTLAGPHRDDVAFTIDGRAADTYGSEGQLKSVLIAWKMAEVSFLADSAAGQPVLLLDDVLSELDERRGEALLEIVDEFEQVIITSPRESSVGMVRRFQHVALE